MKVWYQQWVINGWSKRRTKVSENQSQEEARPAGGWAALVAGLRKCVFKAKPSFPEPDKVETVAVHCVCITANSPQNDNQLFSDTRSFIFIIQTWERIFSSSSGQERRYNASLIRNHPSTTEVQPHVCLLYSFIRSVFFLLRLCFFGCIIPSWLILSVLF